ncbi:MAG: DUF2752 domain-containing protein [Ruminococcus sp.]|nr:DUF2752 domain-containing protein [Ruminococcus sp.]
MYYKRVMGVRKIDNLKYKLLVTFCLLVFIFILYILKIPCPILHFTGIECFGCGMSRAVISALHFDFKAAFNHHLMFFCIPLLYICFLYDSKVFNKKWANILMYILLLLGFLLNWILHLANVL